VVDKHLGVIIQIRPQKQKTNKNKTKQKTRIITRKS